MADTISVLDGSGNAQTVKTNDALHTQLVAILAKIISAPATEAKQDTLIGHVDGVEAALTALLAKDFATQTTLAAILAKIIAAPATEAKQDTAIAANALIGTRTYGTTTRVAVGSASAQSGAITATEVMVHASTRCFIKAGANPTAVADGDSIPIEAGEKFHMRITSGHKIAVIRDTTDGFVHITAVA